MVLTFSDGGFLVGLLVLLEARIPRAQVESGIVCFLYLEEFSLMFSIGRILEGLIIIKEIEL